MNRSKEVVAVMDAGGRKNIGWVVDFGGDDVRSGTGSTSLDGLIEMLANALLDGRTVALGVEAPLYLPIPTSAKKINSKRDDEHNRPWIAAAGAAVTPLGMHQLGFVLQGHSGASAQDACHLRCRRS